MDSTPAATGAKIYNLTLVNASEEYPQVIHDGDRNTPSVKAIMFRLQSTTQTVQYSFKAGGPYFDLKAGEVYWKDGLHFFNSILYFKSPDAGAVVDIEVWN